MTIHMHSREKVWMKSRYRIGNLLIHRKGTEHFTSRQRFIRRPVTYIVFFVGLDFLIIFQILLGVSAGITYGIQVAGNAYASQVFSIFNFLVTGSGKIHILF